MRAVCVDNDHTSLDYFLSLCKEHPLIDETVGFTESLDALNYMEKNFADLALLEINIPQMDGVELAMKIKQKNPKTAIVFLTPYSRYAVEEFKRKNPEYIYIYMMPRLRNSLPQRSILRFWGGE